MSEANEVGGEDEGEGGGDGLMTTAVGNSNRLATQCAERHQLDWPQENRKMRRGDVNRIDGDGVVCPPILRWRS